MSIWKKDDMYYFIDLAIKRCENEEDTFSPRLDEVLAVTNHLIDYYRLLQLRFKDDIQSYPVTFDDVSEALLDYSLEDGKRKKRIRLSKKLSQYKHLIESNIDSFDYTKEKLDVIFESSLSMKYHELSY